MFTTMPEGVLANNSPDFSPHNSCTLNLCLTSRFSAIPDEIMCQGTMHTLPPPSRKSPDSSSHISPNEVNVHMGSSSIKMHAGLSSNSFLDLPV